MKTKTVTKGFDRLEQTGFDAHQSRALVEVTSDLLNDTLEPLIKHLDQRFDSLNETIDHRFEAVDQRFNAMEQRFVSLNETINHRFEAVDQRFNAMEQRFVSLNETINHRFEAVNQRENISLVILVIGFVGIIVGLLALPIIR